MESRITPSSVMWAAHGLEALCDTRVGESFSGMVRRLSLLLELSDSDAAVLKKELRKFYDLRSSFVHGGLGVIHPVADELMDPQVMLTTTRLLQSSDFAVCVLVASLQSLIRKSCTSYAFVEQLVHG